ncbi:MAG TPA: hypothetical protein VMG41_02315 [Gemmatimonadales bacterium]|nr:hypothetical protein [Gemmatimonadales bacterium]
MTYPNTSPWGPHGPQVPAHSVTPNPTPSTPPYIPSAPSPAPTSFHATSPSGQSGGPHPTVAGGPPRPKSTALAVILTLCFGPFGTWYATLGTPQSLLSMFWAAAVVLILVWNSHATLFPFMVISLVWSVLAVRSYNRRLVKE